jgi:hypothetical protein
VVVGATVVVVGATVVVVGATVVVEVLDVVVEVLDVVDVLDVLDVLDVGGTSPSITTVKVRVAVAVDCSSPGMQGSDPVTKVTQFGGDKPLVAATVKV